MSIQIETIDFWREEILGLNWWSLKTYSPILWRKRYAFCAFTTRCRIEQIRGWASFRARWKLMMLRGESWSSLLSNMRFLFSYAGTCMIRLRWRSSLRTLLNDRRSTWKPNAAARDSG